MVVFSSRSVAGTDIIRILPSAPGRVTAILNPTPTPAPAPTLPPASPAPSPHIAEPESAPKQIGVPGRSIKLEVRHGSLSADPGKSWIGAKFDALEPPLATSAGLTGGSGAVITEVTAGSPAAQGGMRVGDIAVSLNGGPIANVNDFRQHLLKSTPGASVTMDVWRFLNEERDLLATLQKLADEGNAGVMFRLGLMYASGNGVPRDDFEAVRWYRKGANKGNGAATAALAHMTLEGLGTDKNPQEAVRLLSSAVDADNTEAKWQLGKILIEGKVVPKDPGRAAQLFQKAAESGHSPSMVDLGLMYNNAVGLPQNFPEAARWFKRAADLDYPLGMVNLGVLYQQGRGVNQSHAAGVDLYRRAADLGHPAGFHNLALTTDKGLGVTHKDPERAAELIMRALSMRFEFSYKQMTENSRIWSPEFRRAVQRRLKEEGIYSGPIDGEFRQPTIAAITTIFNRNAR